MGIAANNLHNNRICLAFRGSFEYQCWFACKNADGLQYTGSTKEWLLGWKAKQYKEISCCVLKIVLGMIL